MGHIVHDVTWHVKKKVEGATRNAQGFDDRLTAVCIFGSSAADVNAMLFAPI